MENISVELVTMELSHQHATPNSDLVFHNSNVSH